MARIDASHGLNERSVTWEDDLEVVVAAARAAGQHGLVEMFQSIETIDCEWDEVEENMTRFLQSASKGTPWAFDAWRVKSSNQDSASLEEDMRETFRVLDRWVAEDERRNDVHRPGLRRSIARVRTMARMFIDAISATKRFRTEVELALQGKRSERYYDAEIEWLVAVGNVERSSMGLQIRADRPFRSDIADVVAWGVHIGDTSAVKGMRGPIFKDAKRKPKLVADNRPPPPGATLFPGQKRSDPSPRIGPLPEEPRLVEDDPAAPPRFDVVLGPVPIDGEGGLSDRRPIVNDSLQRVFRTLSYSQDTATAEDVDDSLKGDLGSRGDPLYENVKPDPETDKDGSV